ncbi:MAG: hypothetical protein IPN62_12665 [Flavobacteriales bacterium]|nr:hypothetical protein [Flavobacteriales bacterium]
MIIKRKARRLFILFAITSSIHIGCKKEERNGTCSDGVLNQNETAVDCGGVCSPCSLVNSGGSGSSSFLNVDRQTIAFGPSSGSSSATVSSNVNWSVASSSSWISVSPTASSNSGTINVYASTNSSSNSRSGVVSISGGGITRTISVSQSGANDPPPTQYGTISFYRAVGNGPIEFSFDEDFIGTIYSTYYSSNPGCFPNGAIYNTDLIPYGSYSYTAYIRNGLGQIVYNYSGNVFLDNPCETKAVGN